MNGPLKNEKSGQILSKSRNLAQATYGSPIFLSDGHIWHLLFHQITAVFRLGLGFKMPASASLGFHRKSVF